MMEKKLFIYSATASLIFHNNNILLLVYYIVHYIYYKIMHNNRTNVHLLFKSRKFANNFIAKIYSLHT